MRGWTRHCPYSSSSSSLSSSLSLSLSSYCPCPHPHPVIVIVIVTILLHCLVGCRVVMGGWTHHCPYSPSSSSSSSSCHRHHHHPSSSSFIVWLVVASGWDRLNLSVFVQQSLLDFAQGFEMANVAACALLCVMRLHREIGRLSERKG